MRERDIIKICYLFYNENMSQVEIGAKMEMSRWKIGRVIKDARERGLVTITINHPQVDLTETEIKIAQKFGIKQAIVVGINEFSGESPLDQIGAAGAVSRIDYPALPDPRCDLGTHHVPCSKKTAEN